MNKIEVGKGIYTISHADGCAKPKYYYIEKLGEVISITANNSFSDIKTDNHLFVIYGTMEEMFLKPNMDGFCYYMGEISNIDKYEKNEYGRYKIPTKILKDFMKTYKNPWGTK